MKDKKLQVRVPEDQYDRLCEILRPDENVSEFIREAIRLQITLRLLGMDD